MQIKMNLNARHIGEIESREFLGDETWKRWKTRYDDCMAYRKTIKGPPTDEQRMMLKNNAEDIAFYERVLFHSSTLGKRCVCARCHK